MLGMDVAQKATCCCQWGNLIQGPVYPDPKNPQNYYCRDDYERYIASKCAGCGKAIIGVFALAVDGTKWHQQCINQDFPCARCHKPIFIDVIDAINQKWHKDCWTCCRCNVKLGTDPQDYMHYSEHPYCKTCGCQPDVLQKITLKRGEATTSTTTSISRKAEEQAIFDNIQKGKETCRVCGNVIASYEAIEFNNGLYHPDCFHCASCGSIIEAGSGYAKRGDNAVCAKCAKQVAACVGCKKPLSGQYLVGPDGKYHADCFKCASCNQSLKSGFVEKNGKGVCPGCGSKPQASVKSTAGTTQKVGGFTIDPRTGQKKYAQ
jgi:hypothetical protein